MKLTVCCIVKNEEFWIDTMLKSALQFADEIIIVDDCSTDKTEEVIKGFKSKKIKYFKGNFQGHCGKQRKYAHDKSTGDWIFFLDADEVVHEQDAVRIKDILEEVEKRNVDLVHVQYIHFIYNFGMVDNSEPVHIGLSRIYKNYKGVEYPMKHHSLPKYNFKNNSFVPSIILWHCGYLKGMASIKSRFEQNFDEQTIHYKFHQVCWRDWHYFGDYPTKRINRSIIPKVLKDKFKMGVGGSRPNFLNG